MRAVYHLLARACFACLLSGCSAIGVPSPWERSQLYRPVRYPSGDWQSVGLDYEDAWFSAADGTGLHGWYLPCRNAAATLLFAHGNAGNVTNLATPLREFCQRHRVSVMVFDYRGYGRSEGTPSEEGLVQDARAARAWLANRAGISERDILLMGRSLGGAVMVDLAANDGAHGLILESTFTSLPDVAQHHVPFWPVHWMMAGRFDSLTKIRDYRGPLLISHGDADETIPFEQGRRLFQAGNKPKAFVTIPGGDHNSPQSEEYHELLDDFIGSLPRVSSRVRQPNHKSTPETARAARFRKKT